MTLNLEDQRQILYATLLQYAPEIGSLRERVLDRLVLVALLGTSSTSPLTTTAIRNRTRVAPSSPGLRIQLIQSTLNRLRSRGLVEYTHGKGKPTYYIGELGRRETKEAAAPVAELFTRVLDSMLRDTEHLCNRRDARTICRTFLAECFARFGERIAREITGKLSDVQLLASSDIDGAFHAATNGFDLSDEAHASLRTRCVRFLRSRDARDRDLKFRLTQGYYVAQLLGLDSNGFNPLAEDSFRGAVFYVDTNILIRSLLSDEHGRSLSELMRVCDQLAIRVHVSRASLDEARTAVSVQYKRLQPILTRMPDTLVERANDDFIAAFLSAREENQQLTPESFFDRFNGITDLVTRLQITLDDRSSSEIVGGRDVSRECEMVRNAAIQSRGWAKSDAVCLHDVAHFMVVRSQRKSEPKTWFLTHDKTLAHAASQLQPNALPFCLSLTGFLQSVSPFVEAPDVRDSLVNLFDAVLTGDISDPTGDALFSVDELMVIDEVRSDVRATSTDKLIRAVDHVKSTVLKGKPLNEADQKELRLELAKFLTSNTEEKLSKLEGEVESEKGKRQEAEQELTERDKKIEGLEASVKTGRELRERGERRERSLELRMAVLGALAAFVLWTFDAAVLASVIEFLQVQNRWTTLGQLAVRLTGSALFVWSVLPVIRRRGGARTTQFLAGAFAVAIAGAGVVPIDVVGTVTSLLGLGGFLAVVYLSFADWRGMGQQHGD